MRRILQALTVAMLIAAMAAVYALPALADPPADSNANCQARWVTGFHGPGHQGNSFGQAVSEEAQETSATGVPFGHVFAVPDAQSREC